MQGLTIFCADYYRPGAGPIGQQILAGINSPTRTVADFKCVVTGNLKFPDHHPYSDRELENIVQSAKMTKADCLVTTEKDYVRIAAKIAWPIDLAVIGIETAFGDDDQSFNAFLESKLKALLKKDLKQSCAKRPRRKKHETWKNQP